MNPSQHHDDRLFDDPAFINPALEAEWQAQEQAMRTERANGAGDDVRLQSYRAIARALREPLPDGLPADFAECMAQQVEAQAPQSAVFTTPFERITLGTMIALFGIAIGIAIALSASTTLQPVGEAVRQITHWVANPWLIALGVCLAVSTAMQQWMRTFAMRAV